MAPQLSELGHEINAVGGVDLGHTVGQATGSRQLGGHELREPDVGAIEVGRHGSTLTPATTADGGQRA